MAVLARSACARVAPRPAVTAVDADVIVIGAGASGLACARSLDRAGIDVVVVEARDRVGGRIHTLRRDGEVVEAGAHVVHGGRASTLSILEEAGLAVTPLEPAEVVVWVDGRAYGIRDLAAAGVMPPWSLEEFVVRADAAEGSVADLLDALPVGRLERAICEDWLLQTWGASAEELSAAGLAQAKRSATAGDGQFVVADGYDRVAGQLARGLEVRTGVVVRRVVSRSGSVEVVAEDGESLRATAVVVTVPPAVVADGTLCFGPSLPPERIAAARALPLADAVVVVLLLGTEAARSSWDFVVGPLGGFWQTRAGSRAMVGVIKGAPARGARKLLGAAPLAEVLPTLLPKLHPAGVEGIDIVDWGADPYALGAYSYPGLFATDAARIWAAPLGSSLFFAGEATCWERHRGMVHGAIESGVRCADELRSSVGGGQQVARR
jgi:monoamine oxidase